MAPTIWELTGSSNRYIGPSLEVKGQTRHFVLLYQYKRGKQVVKQVKQAAILIQIRNRVVILVKQVKQAAIAIQRKVVTILVKQVGNT